MAFTNHTTTYLISNNYKCDILPFIAAETVSDLMISNDSVTTKVTAGCTGRLYSNPEVKSDGASNTTLKMNLAALKEEYEDMYNALNIKYTSDTNLGSFRHGFSDGSEVVYTAVHIMETPAQYTKSGQFIDVQLKFEK